MRLARSSVWLVVAAVGFARAEAYVSPPGGARAEATPVSGPVELALSGLELELPRAVGREYHVSGNWAIEEDGFWSYDLIDEEDATTGSLIAATLVSVGRFDKPCAELIAGEPLERRAPPASADRWGARWTIAAGARDVGLTAAAWPTVLLCTSRADEMTVVITHYLASEPTSLRSEIAVARVLEDTPVVAAIAGAFAGASARAGAPTHRRQVVNRGPVAARREIDLAQTAVRVALPDDGFVWVALPKTGDDVSDLIARAAPSLPEVTLEVARLDTAECAEAFEALPNPRRLTPARGLPSGWIAGPTLTATGVDEYIACKPDGESVIIVGIYADAPDLTRLRPLLRAIGAAPRRR